MRSLLICHASDEFDRVGLAAWLGSFSELAGVVVLEETRVQRVRRAQRELKRIGAWRMLDVLAMRAWQRATQSARDRRWTQHALAVLRQRYGAAPQVPEILASDVNDAAVVKFVREQRPDFVLARCKQLLKRKLMSLPPVGCFVLHPGICPEYRNAHGCFWALAQRDLAHVGMTLLKIDSGVDTGPVYGHYSYAFDERRESHVVIQYRVVLENLDHVAQRLREVMRGEAQPIDVHERASSVWGQPWFTRYVRWQRAARSAPA